ncbi:MAG: DUF1254 domain-containing protein [Dehalococcoidia bacterium]|jgi:uncharacterized membrane protein
MNRWLWWTALATVAVAVIVHFITLFAIPIVIMNSAMTKYPQNVLMKGGRTTADNRMVVRPSPDLVYSILLYDVSQQPIRFKAQIPADTYWSVAFYAANTDNFFVLNDQQVQSNPVEILLVKQGAAIPENEKAQVVVSPSDRGIMLVRHLLVSDDQYDQVVKIQGQSSIEMGY